MRREERVISRIIRGTCFHRIEHEPRSITLYERSVMGSTFFRGDSYGDSSQ